MNKKRSQLGLRIVKRKHWPATPDPTREKLLEAAGPIFANRGYQATTIREICAAAGANVAAINYHFGDKLGLYTEVLQQSVRAAQVLAVHNAPDQNLSLIHISNQRSQHVFWGGVVIGRVVNSQYLGSSHRLLQDLRIQPQLIAEVIILSLIHI